MSVPNLTETFPDALRFAAGAGKPANARDRLESLLADEQGFSADAARRNGVKGAIKTLFPKRTAAEHAVLAVKDESGADDKAASENDDTSIETEILKGNQVHVWVLVWVYGCVCMCRVCVRACVSACV